MLPCEINVDILTAFTFCGTVDELIRQVTVNSAERGLLLLRVRDEIRMTIDAYKTLYESRYTTFSEMFYYRYSFKTP